MILLPPLGCLDFPGLLSRAGPVAPAGLTGAVARGMGGHRPVRRPIPAWGGMAGARITARARKSLAVRTVAG